MLARLLWPMAAFAALCRVLFFRVGTGPDGGVPTYNPNQVSTGATAGTDIWGLGDDAQTKVNVGVLQPPDTTGLTAGTGRRAPWLEQANVSPAPAGSGGYGTIQTKTAQQLLQDLAKLSQTDKAKYIALQQQLYQAGFYGSMPKEDLAVGIFDQDTVSAFKAALARTIQLNASGQALSIWEVLGQSNPAIAQRDKKAAATAIKPGYMAQYSDPQTVAALAQQAAQSTLGRNLTTAEISQFTKAFHQSEQQWNANQKAALASQAAGHDVTAPTQPSAQADAMQYVEQGPRGVEAQGNRMADYVGVLERMLGGT